MKFTKIIINIHAGLLSYFYKRKKFYHILNEAHKGRNNREDAMKESLVVYILVNR